MYSNVLSHDFKGASFFLGSCTQMACPNPPAPWPRLHKFVRSATSQWTKLWLTVATARRTDFLREKETSDASSPSDATTSTATPSSATVSLRQLGLGPSQVEEYEDSPTGHTFHDCNSTGKGCIFFCVLHISLPVPSQTSRLSMQIQVIPSGFGRTMT